MLVVVVVVVCACSVTLVGYWRIVCVNAGDSRAIVVRRDGTVARLSRDHKGMMKQDEYQTLVSSIGDVGV